MLERSRFDFRLHLDQHPVTAFQNALRSVPNVIEVFDVSLLVTVISLSSFGIFVYTLAIFFWNHGKS